MIHFDGSHIFQMGWWKTTNQKWIVDFYGKSTNVPWFPAMGLVILPIKKKRKKSWHISCAQDGSEAVKNWWWFFKNRWIHESSHEKKETAGYVPFINGRFIGILISCVILW